MSRFFSPQPGILSSYSSLKNTQRLKLATSAKNLLSKIDQQAIAVKKIGHYTYNLNDQIGQGYSSKVYKAQSTHPQKKNQKYAIKVIQLKKYSLSSLEMLSNEIQILKKLDHPNVIKCYDIFKSKSQCYIITQLCQEGDLMMHLTKKIKLTEKQSIQIVAQIIQGVKYLHQKKIIHRDLKPANILRSQNNWKIADFGFAIEGSNQIKTKYNVGTPLYMPLQSLVSNLYSFQSDIFSIGIILYQILTGTTPWQCRSERQLIRKITSTPFKIPQKLKHLMSSKIRKLLMQFCSVDKQKRINHQKFIKLDMSNLQQLNPQEEKSQISTQDKIKSKLLSQNKSLDNLMMYRKMKSQTKKLSNEDLKSSIKLTQNLSFIKNKKNLEGNENNEILSKIKSSAKLSILENPSSIMFQPEKCQIELSQTKNTHILINQLHYCRFIYYMFKNKDNFLIGQKNKNRMGLILLKHIQFLIKQLLDSKTNWLNLQNWDSYITSKKYFTTFLTVKQYSIRYEKQYLEYLKFSDVTILRGVNQDFSEFSSLSIQNPLNHQFYSKLKNYLALMLREFNHNLIITVSRCQDNLTNFIKGNIEGIKAIQKYYRLIQLEQKVQRNYDKFQQQSHIKVTVDYQKVDTTSIDQYLQLRSRIKFI